MGGHISPLLVESKRIVIDVRHEVRSVFAADAVARLTGRVGVAAVTAGPGITNTVTAVKNAQMAQSPVLFWEVQQLRCSRVEDPSRISIRWPCSDPYASTQQRVGVFETLCLHFEGFQGSRVWCARACLCGTSD